MIQEELKNPLPPVPVQRPFMDGKMWVIVCLVLILFFSYLGINLLHIFGNVLQNIVNYVSPLIASFFNSVSYSSGTIINKTADVVSDSAKVGIDIAEGAVQNVGNLLLKSSSKTSNEPKPDVPEDTIQKSLGSGKTKWCLVGEYQNKRGCIDIAESDKCISGQVFPNEQMCLNPNMYHTKQQ
jgi:hypothetical protein